jgi:hypothetical protein
MERFIVNQLKWDLITITPIEYIDYLFNQVFGKIKLDVASVGPYQYKLLEVKRDYFENNQIIDYNKIVSHSRTLIFVCLIGKKLK